VSYSWLLILPAALLVWTSIVALVGSAVQAADRNEPIGPTAPILARISREAIARAALTALGLFALGRPMPKFTPPATRKGPPVLLLPGLTWNRASLWALRIFLVRRGFGWVQALDRGGRESTLAAEADALAGAVARMKAMSGSSQVDLVAFSTGGLVAAWYLRHHGSASVRQLVTLGTPWKGTRLAVFGRGRAVDEIRYGSHVLDGLWPPPVPTVCVYSPDDPVVVPSSSAIPPHSADAVRVDEAGHVELLVSARAYRAVLAALERPLADASAVVATPTAVPETPYPDATSADLP
jgi:pimeloyl-ACP methyl ester carboxylesterase